MTVDGLTPTETKIFQLLSDGMFHLRDEVRSCLSDELASFNAMALHITNLRKKLPNGYLVVCVRHRGKSGYQMVRSIPSANDGKM